MNESGVTDNAGDISNASESTPVFNASKYGLNVNAPDYSQVRRDGMERFGGGEIDESYFSDRKTFSPDPSPSKTAATFGSQSSLRM